MKITELTGIKNTRFNAELDQEEEAGYEEFPRENLRAAVQELIRQGWEVLGKGYFSYVVTRPGLPYVVKLSYSDRGYRKYLEFVRANANNPHVPKVRGLGVRLRPDIYAIRIENLEPLTSWKDPLLRKYVSPELPADFDSLFHPRNEEFLKTNHPELRKVIDYIERTAFENDLNWTNVMRRGDTLVITDPFAF